MPVVHFSPMGRQKEIVSGATILAAANQCDIPLGQSCSGDGICGWCRVQVLSGLENLAPPSALEQRLLKEKAFAANERAACLARVRGDIVITTTYW
jgi:ferredoxin